MNTFIEVLGLVGILLAVWGTQTRGTWSRNIGIVGGILWLPCVIILFIQLGISGGLVYLLATFAFGAILQRILPKKL